MVSPSRLRREQRIKRYDKASAPSLSVEKFAVCELMKVARSGVELTQKVTVVFEPSGD